MTDLTMLPTISYDAAPSDITDLLRHHQVLVALQNID